MTRQTINTGTGANSNNGDPLRTAFTKINSNFEELYTLIGSGTGNVVDIVGPLFDHTDHNNVTVTLDSVNDRIVLDAQFSEIIQDLKGSVFADDSTLLVDGVSGTIPASVINGVLNNNIIGDVTGNLTGNSSGDHYGSVYGDDSTRIIDSTESSINLDGTVKGNIIPDQNIAYDIGSPTNRFKDLWLSGTTINIGTAQLSASTTGGINLPAGSQIPGLTQAKLKPALIYDERQIDPDPANWITHYATGAPASATIIDQATWIWSDPAKRYPTFQPSVYSATIDGSGNITGLSLDTANYYTDTSEQWDIINTDNLIALDAGIDITDPAAIRASSYFEVLPATVGSASDTVLASGASQVSGSIDITDITNSSGALNINGDVDFTSASIQNFAPGNVYANSGQFLYVTSIHASGSATNVAFTYDASNNRPSQTFYGKTEFGFNGQTPVIDFDGTTIQNWTDPNVVNDHGAAVISIGINTATMDDLTVRIVENSPGDIDVEFNYDAGATATVSANGDLPNRFNGTTTFAAGNTTWTTMNILDVVGDKGEFTIVDHSFHKIYRVTTFAKALPAPGTAGDAYCVIERLK